MVQVFFSTESSRRLRVVLSGLIVVAFSFFSVGCRGRQTADVLSPSEANMVGSHQAGAEIYRPLVAESVDRLLARQMTPEMEQQAALIRQTGHQDRPEVIPPGEPQGPLPGMPGCPVKRICFVGVENHSAEELGDFKEQLYELIDAKILDAPVFQSVSRRAVQAGLRQTGLRSDDLFIPAQMRQFTAVMEQMGEPFDYLLFAKVTSGTTQDHRDSQRDYLLTLELVNIHTMQSDKDSAMLSKAYNRSLGAKMRSWGR